jgi:hypothetical protein
MSPGEYSTSKSLFFFLLQLDLSPLPKTLAPDISNRLPRACVRLSVLASSADDA